MSAIGLTIVAGAAKELGLPILKKFLTKRFGKTAGDVSGQIAEKLTEAVAKRAGFDVDDLPDANKEIIEKAAREVEVYDAPEIINGLIESQELSNKLQVVEMSKGSFFSWAWRPGMMYLIGLFWLWSIIIAPFYNALSETNVVIVPFDTLITLTGIYMALYMGGHTMKSIIMRK